MHTIRSANLVTIVRAGVLFVVVIGSGGRAFAQNAPAVEFSGGFQFIHFNEENAETLNQGWYGEVAYNPSHVVSLVGQVGTASESREATFSNEGLVLNAKGTARLITSLAGVRLTDRRHSRAVWFGHGLVGRVRTSARASLTGEDHGIAIEETKVTAKMSDVGFQFGGGVNLQLAAHIGLRAGIDSLRVFSDGGSGTAVQVTVGVVVPFGRR